MRLFIALRLPNEVLESLAECQRRLAQLDLAYRWTSPESLHLTLAFLGETPEARLADVTAALDEAAAGANPFTLTVDGVGTFPPKGVPRVIWAGIGGDRDRLLRLQGALRAALAAQGFPTEERPFSPHVTLGRTPKRPAGDAHDRLRQTDVSTAASQRFGEWTVQAAHVIRSVLHPHGARHTTLYTSPLMGDGGRGPRG